MRPGGSRCHDRKRVLGMLGLQVQRLVVEKGVLAYETHLVNVSEDTLASRNALTLRLAHVLLS